MSSQHRPDFIDVRAQANDNSSTQPLKSPLRSPPLRSPRLPVAGDVPPELSPLDAFALQSRLLAKQLEDSAKAGHRMSRLPPLTTSSPLVMQGRSDFYRSMSYDNSLDGDRESSDRQDKPKSAVSQPVTPAGLGAKTPEVEQPMVRPQSMHPRMSRVPPTPDDSVPPPVPEYARERQAMLLRNNAKPAPVAENEETSYFGARRERSPSPLAEELFNSQPPRVKRPYSFEINNAANNVQGDADPISPLAQPTQPEQPEQPEKPEQPAPQTQAQADAISPNDASQPNTGTPQFSNAYSTFAPFTQSPERPLHSKSSFDSNSGGLAPPRTLFPKRSSSIMSAPVEMADEDGRSTMASSFCSINAPRKLSASSVASPGYGSFHRSPSISSDMSVPLPRPSFNFSRPMSRVGTPSLETPARQASSDSQTSYSQSSFVLADDTANTPVSMNSEGFPDSLMLSDDNRIVPPSYVYSKYNLPRGKMLERSNARDADNQPQTSDQLEQHMVPLSNMQTFPHGGQAPPSPPSRPSSAGNLVPRPSVERSKLSTEMVVQVHELSPNPSQTSTDCNRSLEDDSRGRKLGPSHDSHDRGRTPASVTGTSDSASTIKAHPTHVLATATEISAEEHVDKAIALHEKGMLNESTYHLRHAARQGNPTGMLLYALACRHGWGMRANPREGADWLRKAADCASSEIAGDEAMIKEGKVVDSVDRKTRKAQFALSIYELGVSYLNGWGIDQDKKLALHCFEVAGSWGDVDALAEAGFCYAQGVGCKKNLKQSAHYYRQAEAKGMSMVGNSWIHKAKYNDDNESLKSEKEKKARSKSRNRTMFGHKHNQ
ncbi:cell cycle inhibitor protein [Grosmannia clavigera kw1407]|uniref:Cell cycle inhibitor protein n=1 Tax=Grosmannia clavigera (strain kw1407 / UAMH 11150) TaxID=655863 RepID=F0X9E8_GROCL|nr:cell cycle inhibitor protein [Grosmannia clavigera kw1407]EFX05332.1 cell cycle inhibitor protein [Grosmannia clavigera kw1407]